MKKSIFPVLAIIVLVLAGSAFASSHLDFEWGVSVDDRYNYSWSVQMMGTIVFLENFYIIIDHLDDIPESIEPTDVWALSESGFEVSIFWSNGTSLNITTVQHTLTWYLLPMGNWSELTDITQQGQSFFDDDTFFGYEIYDYPGGTGIHKTVKFQKTNGVLDLFHMHEFVDNIPVTRIDIQLTSSLTVNSSTTSTTTPSTTGNPDNIITLAIIVGGAGGSVVIVLIILVKRRT
jgi:hypothetical protein